MIKHKQTCKLAFCLFWVFTSWSSVLTSGWALTADGQSEVRPHVSALRCRCSSSLGSGERCRGFSQRRCCHLVAALQTLNTGTGRSRCECVCCPIPLAHWRTMIFFFFYLGWYVMYLVQILLFGVKPEAEDVNKENIWHGIPGIWNS